MNLLTKVPCEFDDEYHCQLLDPITRLNLNAQSQRYQKQVEGLCTDVS